MKKYLKFKETLISNDGKTKYIKGVKYEVTYENDDVFMLGKQNGIACGILKKCLGKQFDVVETSEESADDKDKAI